MNRYAFCLIVLSSLLCWSACTPEDPVVEEDDEKEEVRPPWHDKDDKGEDNNTDPTPTPGPYDYLNDYGPLKSYIDRTKYPEFKLGAAIPVNDFFKKSSRYNMAVENLDEMTPENAFKHGSVVRPDGSMDFSQVKRTIEEARAAGLTIYGHTLAWHAQQTGYLKSVIKGQRVELPPSEVAELPLLEVDFNGGSSPFIGWGNNSIRTVENGVLKVSNPSAVQRWEVQFAYDLPEPFVVGKTYVLKFKVRGSSQGTLSAGLQITDGYRSAGDYPDIHFDTQWKDVDVECECLNAGGNRLIFSLGDFAGDIYIDDFMFIDASSSYKYEPLTDEEKKEVLIGELDRWIKGMMEVTAGYVSVWDAVNEAISGSDKNGDGFYELESGDWASAEHFFWQDYLGSEDYVPIVIGMARKYYAEYGGTAPLRLFINDYNLESDWDDNRKLKSLIHWIGIWESDGVTKIDGIGTQMHLSYFEDSRTQKSKEDHIVKMLQLMAATGKLVKITELDMGYVDMAGNTLKASQLTDNQHRQMAGFYEFIVSKYLEIVPPSQQYGITHWAPVDPPVSAWRGDEPVGLWDSDYNRKYAYAGFADGLMGQ